MSDRLAAHRPPMLRNLSTTRRCRVTVGAAALVPALLLGVLAGTAYVDLAVALLTARGTDGYETVWFYQRLSAACAKHER